MIPQSGVNLDKLSTNI